ncbi:MAG: hypothetical protein M1829_002714 [Trizodia sp. TS-e1964]|nr:MAG: hypothetical protein M1829_002714 [Trizodia sp. TS-e1964]
MISRSFNSFRAGYLPSQVLSLSRTALSRCPSRSLSTSPHLSVKQWRGTIVASLSGGLIGTLGIIYYDHIKVGLAAAERTRQVLKTLIVNVNDYRTTLTRSVDDELGHSIALRECHKRCAERTLHLLEKQGSIFIKLGQHLSSLNYLLPPEWTTTFVPLQDKCPISSMESIEAMFIKDTGYKITDTFDNFEPMPIGAASLAQVHCATLKGTGQRVAVKVQHPALEDWVPLDLALTRFAFSTLKWFFPHYDLEWLSREMDMSLPQELDFSIEGSNALRAKAYFSGKGLPLVIPNVIWAKKRILVMENISGHRFDDLEYLDSNGIDRDEVSAALARVFNEMIFGENAPLHCDPHGGNIAIRKISSGGKVNFEIILYDHGLYRDIPNKLRCSYAKLWLAVINADEKGMRKYSRDVAGITDDQG